MFQVRLVVEPAPTVLVKTVWVVAGMDVDIVAGVHEPVVCTLDGPGE
jgi:hypothetical protein